MKRFPANTGPSGETAEYRRIDLTGTRWRALILPTVLGLAFFFVLMVRALPTHSDDGPGVEEIAFDSPVIIWKYPFGDKSLLHTTKSTPGDLLTNGDMDQMGFYWRYPNHWIAGAWFEWFSTRLQIPEFDDGHRNNFAHTHPSSQRIHKWAVSYAGGLMQSPTVNPCTYYRFQVYGHSRPGVDDPPTVNVASHMKVGIEPNGWMSGRTVPKYDPGLEPEEFPATVVWSPEATHNFVWAPYEVSAEALSDAITVILFSNPEVNPDRGVWWNDTLWDTASLVEVPPPSGTLLDGDYLPNPDGFVADLSIKALPRMSIVEWDTPSDASSQVLYRVVEPSEPITLTEPLSNTLYLPLVAAPMRASSLPQHSPPDQTPVRHHLVTFGGLPEKYSIELVALSRRSQDGVCVTSASTVTRAESAGDSYFGYLPTVLGGD